jgi:hypothetical protein
MGETSNVSHAQLLTIVEGIVELVHENWKKEQSLEPLAFTWPSNPVETDDDREVFGSIVCQLKKIPNEQWTKALSLMVQRTNAYGLALVERRGSELRVLLETPEGARAWITQLHRHGDLLAVGPTVIRDNAECVGILWRPKRGNA